MPPGPSCPCRPDGDSPVALEVDLDECLGCGACESACPQGAITQSDGFIVTYVIDPLLCNDCVLCLDVCPVDGLVADPDWAVCHGRGCPLSSARYAGTECSEGRRLCPTCGSMLWKMPGGEWECRTCVAVAEGGATPASCPKVRRAKRLVAAAHPGGDD